MAKRLGLQLWNQNFHFAFRK